eukprot:TRINITY_DN596_c0_g1::TRINITY_DN596_c0_g1_i1::g.10456::m.10456 TRINITY_DN596_c0_g1::TRINITY_DN596_c0_g1_i1::g.10456  ORF type:complete len:140 (+),score=27.84 TRINITY_DN596_c0_g1_i1:37-456(+)
MNRIGSVVRSVRTFSSQASSKQASGTSVIALAAAALAGGATVCAWEVATGNSVQKPSCGAPCMAKKEMAAKEEKEVINPMKVVDPEFRRLDDQLLAAESALGFLKSQKGQSAEKTAWMKQLQEEADETRRRLEALPKMG